LIIRAVEDKLRGAVEVNRSLEEQLGREKMQQLHAERSLLKRENDYLRQIEEGKTTGEYYSLQNYFSTKKRYRATAANVRRLSKNIVADSIC
jgi:hypothetical protein